MMTLCICGWYYHQPFYDRVLDWVLQRRDARVITHQEPTIPLPCPHMRAKNIGLEWHAYNEYLQNTPIQGPVLFIHDDTEILNPQFFAYVESQCADRDLAFIFPDEQQERMNGGAHGRCVYMSRKLLGMFRPIGFWYDENNGTDITSAKCNQGIQHFLQDVGWLMHRPTGKGLIWRNLITGGADFGYRGQLGEAGAQYRLTHFKQ